MSEQFLCEGAPLAPTTPLLGRFSVRVPGTAIRDGVDA
ncbi:MAG: hypothetical protein QOC85_1507 [Streptomyces sp.]|jgi:hypothetical protein|nr:hypothetical protein [Streptomyces sp.]